MRTLAEWQGATPEQLQIWVALDTHAFLALNAPEGRWSTNDVVAGIFPPWPLGHGAPPRRWPDRQRVYDALKTLATTGLAECATLGPALKRYGRTFYPWLWSPPMPHASGA